MKKSRMSKFIRKPLLGTTLFSLAVAGTMVPPPLPGYSAFAAKRVKDKFPDNCETLREPFQKIKNEQLGRSIVGSVLGGLAGAVVGSQIKKEEIVYDRNGRPVRVKQGNRALEGAIAGAVIGGLGGYLTGIEKHRANQAELQKALERRQSERTQYEGLSQKLADLGNCRNQQIFDVQVKFDAQQITAEVASSRLDKIEKWITKDDSIIDKAAGMDAESVTRYAQAVAVADGESAQSAEEGGAAMVERYRGDSSSYEGNVSVIYDESGQPTTVRESEPDQPTTTKAYVKAGKGANVRDTPSTQGKVIGTLPFRAEIQVLPSDVDGWSQLTFEDRLGYIANSLLSINLPVAAPKAIRMVATPRPERAPGKIVVRQRSAATPTTQKKVSKAIGESQTFKAADMARRTSNKTQLAAGRNRLAAGAQAARS